MTDETGFFSPRNVGEGLRMYRTRAGLTAAELADLAGTTQSTVTRYEQGQWKSRRVVIDLVRALAEANDHDVLDVLKVFELLIQREEEAASRAYLQARTRAIRRRGNRNNSK